MTTTTFSIRSVSDAIRATGDRCDAPTLMTLSADGPTVHARAENVPGGPLTADSAPATLAAMARLIPRHRALFADSAVVGYAVALPGERVAFAVDSNGNRHHVQLPGAPTEPLRSDRWDAIIDSLTAMTTAATH